MQNIQDIFAKMIDIKKEQKAIRSSYKEALDSTPSFREVNEQLKALKVKKRQIETDVKSAFLNDFDKLEQLKQDLSADRMMLSDIAITKLMKGETVEVVDEKNNVYDPQFNVHFKKRM